MTISTKRPDSVSSEPAAWTNVGGSPTKWQAVSDDSTGTSINSPGGATIVFGLADISVGAGTFIRSVTPRILASNAFGGDTGVSTVLIRFTDGSNYTATTTISVVGIGNTYYVGNAYTLHPSGVPWTQSNFNSVLIEVIGAPVSGSGAGTLQVFEVYADLDVNSAPVTVASAPTGTVTLSTRPPTVFTYTDVDGDQMTAYEIAYFTSTQYGIGGFNPATSPAYFRSGTRYASSPPAAGYTPTVDLENSGTWRAYVRVAQQGFTSTTGWSDWAFSQFTMGVTLPVQPTLVATLESGNRRVKLDITTTEQTTYRATQRIQIERSANGGPWQIVPSLDSIDLPDTGPNQTATVYDYSMERNTPVVYRAIATASPNGFLLTGVYSSSTGAVTFTSTEWELINPFDHTENMILLVVGSAGDSVRYTKPEEKAFFTPLGRTRKVAVSGMVLGEEGTLPLEFISETEYAKYVALRASQQTLLLVCGWTNQQWWIQVESAPQFDLYGYYPTYRTATLPYIEVDAPT